jgi:signal transduction histidine kinase
MSDDGPKRTMQHVMNNPLTALMTDIQLLQLEDPSPSTATACGRILDLARRLGALSRKLGDIPEQP